MIREGNGTPLQYSCLGNPMDRGAWSAAVHGVVNSRIRLSDFTFTVHFHALEKEMATHFSVLAWRIPGTGEPGGLLSMGLHRVGHDWRDLAAAAAVGTLGTTALWLKCYCSCIVSTIPLTLNYYFRSSLINLANSKLTLSLRTLRQCALYLLFCRILFPTVCTSSN